MIAKVELENGVSEEGLKALVARGYSLDVVCVESAAYTNQYYSGGWTVRAVAPDDNTEWVLVTQRNTRSPRIIKTLVGLVRLLEGVGLEGVHIPLRAGGRRTNCRNMPHLPSRESRSEPGESEAGSEGSSEGQRD